MIAISEKLRIYWQLIKSLQTGLLVATGLAGYMSGRCPVLNIPTLLGLFASLVLSISGSTILNMWWDRDLDARMERTSKRPLAAGLINPKEALMAGLLLSLLGVSLAFAMDRLYGSLILAGLFFDVVVYTIWLKRRTPWSIVWGGVSGGMPILAGRALAVGTVDWIGIVLALGILFWIPTHILTFCMRYQKDYERAGIPTFVSAYGLPITRTTIAVSSIFAALAMGLSAWGIGMSWGYLRLLGVLSAGLLTLAVTVTFKSSEQSNFGLFKYASVYMLAAMILVVIEAV